MSDRFVELAMQMMKLAMQFMYGETCGLFKEMFEVYFAIFVN